MTTNNATQPVCFCSVCHNGIHEVDFNNGTLAEHRKYDIDGTLDYIEIAHKPCARRYNVTRPGYWDMGE